MAIGAIISSILLWIGSNWKTIIGISLAIAGTVTIFKAFFGSETGRAIEQTVSIVLAIMPLMVMLMFINMLMSMMTTMTQMTKW